jgi:hypothetical protein
MPALALYFFTLSAIRVPKQTRDKSNNTHMVESGMIYLLRFSYRVSTGETIAFPAGLRTNPDFLAL